jgi:hypothetical protein
MAMSDALNAKVEDNAQRTSWLTSGLGTQTRLLAAYSTSNASQERKAEAKLAKKKVEAEEAGGAARKTATSPTPSASPSSNLSPSKSPERAGAKLASSSLGGPAPVGAVVVPAVAHKRSQEIAAAENAAAAAAKTAAEEVAGAIKPALFGAAFVDAIPRWKPKARRHKRDVAEGCALKSAYSFAAESRRARSVSRLSRSVSDSDI